jgi:hypothetical protein
MSIIRNITNRNEVFWLLLGPFYDFTAVIFKPISGSQALPGGVLKTECSFLHLEIKLHSRRTRKEKVEQLRLQVTLQTFDTTG